MSFPGSSVLKNSPGNTGDTGLIPVAGRSPGEENWLPTPVFLPGKSHEQRNLAGLYSMGLQKSQTGLSDYTTMYQDCLIDVTNTNVG